MVLLCRAYRACAVHSLDHCLCHIPDALSLHSRGPRLVAELHADDCIATARLQLTTSSRVQVYRDS